jgi:ankyrin repeat protein
VNKAGDGAGTPLCRAALFGRTDIVETLLKAGAKINVICDSDHGDSPLMDALRGVLLSEMPGATPAEEAGADPSGDGQQGEETGASDKTSEREQKLRKLKSVRRDDFLAVARLLLARGADVNVVAGCDLGETALMYAAMGANVEMVEAVLARGAKVDQSTPVLLFLREFQKENEKAKRLALPAFSKEQRALLEWSERTGAAREKIRDLLKAAGAKEAQDDDKEAQDDDEEHDPPTAEDLEEVANEAFSSTIQQGDLEDLERLIKAYSSHPLGVRVLPEAVRIAIVYNRIEAVRLLLARGVDANGGKYRLLGQAAQQGDAKSVRMLLEAGADVNATDEEGRTALDYAESWANSSGDHREVIEILKAHGAQSNKRP